MVSAIELGRKPVSMSLSLRKWGLRSLLRDFFSCFESILFFHIHSIFHSLVFGLIVFIGNI